MWHYVFALQVVDLSDWVFNQMEIMNGEMFDEMCTKLLLPSWMKTLNK